MTTRRIGLALALVALLASPGHAQRPATRDIVWPEPPETPRIRYVGQLNNEKDVGKTLGFFSKMKGALAGNSGESFLSIERPHDVYVLDGTRFFVTDGAIGKLVLFDTEARSAKVVGESGEGQLSKPMGLGGAPAGTVYVADATQDRVVAFDRDGNFVRSYGGPQHFMNPVDVATDRERDRLYVVDSYLHQVLLFSLTTGEFMGLIGRDEDDLQAKRRRFAGVWSGGVHGASDDDDGTPPDSVPEEVDISREPRDLVLNRGIDPGEFRYPAFVAVGPDGHIYVTDQMNFRLQAFDTDGVFLREIGAQGLTPGSFARPKGVAVDTEGHIYVADAAFNNIQIFDADGQLLLNFADGGVDEGQVFLPLGIEIDAQNRIYVADRYNNRIQVYQYLHVQEGGETSGADAPPDGGVGR